MNVHFPVSACVSVWLYVWICGLDHVCDPSLATGEEQNNKKRCSSRKWKEDTLPSSFHPSLKSLFQEKEKRSVLYPPLSLCPTLRRLLMPFKSTK